MNHRLAVALSNTLIAAVCLFGADGCITYQPLDDLPAIRAAHLIGRRYVVGIDSSFWTWASPSWAFSGGSEREIVLPKGTLLHISEVLSIEGGIADSPPAALGIVDSGSHKGELIGVGVVGYIYTPYVRFNSYASRPTARGQIDNPLIPLPEKPPDWLDVNSIPPAVKQVDSAVLVGATEDADGVVRLYALQELIRRDPAAAVPLCGNMLNDPLSEVRRAAWEELKQAGPNAVPMLDQMIKHLADPNEIDNERVIIDAMAAAGPEAGARVAAILNGEDDFAIERAAEVLEKQGTAAAPYIPELVKLLDARFGYQTKAVSSKKFSAYYALYSAILAIQSTAALEEDIMQSRSSKPEIRILAISNLGEFARNPDHKIGLSLRNRAIAVVRSAALDPDPHVKKTALDESRFLPPS